MAWWAGLIEAGSEHANVSSQALAQQEDFSWGDIGLEMLFRGASTWGDYKDPMEQYMEDMYRLYGPSVFKAAQDFYGGGASPFYKSGPFRRSDRYVAQLTEDQRRLIGSILDTAWAPNPQNVAAQDLLRTTLEGGYLPVQGNPYAQPFLEAVSRETQRGIEANLPAFTRQLQGIAGGGLAGAGSAIPALAEFQGDLLQRATDAQLMALMGMYDTERSRMMAALGLAPAIGDIETQRLMGLLPVAEIPRAIQDLGLQRAYTDFARMEEMDFLRGQSAVSTLGGGSPIGYGPSAPPYMGSGAGLGQMLHDLTDRPYQPTTDPNAGPTTSPFYSTPWGQTSYPTGGGPYVQDSYLWPQGGGYDLGTAVGWNQPTYNTGGADLFSLGEQQDMMSDWWEIGDF